METISQSLSHDPCKECPASGSGTMDDTPAYKIMMLLKRLDRGEVPPIKELRNTLSHALASCSHDDTNNSEEEKLEGVCDFQVREWLSSTFTRSESVYEAHHVAMTPIIRFKAVANTIIIGQYLGSIHRESPLQSNLYYSEELVKYFKENIDSWEFDIFECDCLCNQHTLKYTGYELFKKHQLFDKFEIPLVTFDLFLTKIEVGYNTHGNPYHNACHGSDVAQTIHYFIQTSGIKDVLSDLEVMSMILAGLIHDVDHPGTTNSFQIAQKSKYALLYNDRSVLENHHLYFSFNLLQQTECDFLCHLSDDDYKLLRGLVVDMVLATDMSFHFDQFKHMRHLMTSSDVDNQLLVNDRSKVFNLLLHMADISHPGKPWKLHHKWSVRLEKEFYCQGDEEKRQGLPPSPLCNRDNGNLPESQLGFIEYIVIPSYEMCGDLLEFILTPPHLPRYRSDKSLDRTLESCDIEALRVWNKYLFENKKKWKELSMKKEIYGRREDLSNGWSHNSNHGDRDEVCVGDDESIENHEMKVEAIEDKSRNISKEEVIDSKVEERLTVSKHATPTTKLVTEFTSAESSL